MRGEKATETLNLRIQPSEKEAFQLAADTAGISLSSWVKERLRSSAVGELARIGVRAPFLKPVTFETPHGKSH